MAFTAAFLSGCTSSYQPVSFTSGYSETSLGVDVIQLHFKGIGCPSGERFGDLLLYRNAGNTLLNGCCFFPIFEKREDVSVGTYPTPGQFTGTTTYSGGGQARTTGTYTPEVNHNTRKPEASALIKMFRDDRASNSPVLFEARLIIRSVGAKYGLALAKRSTRSGLLERTRKRGTREGRVGRGDGY